MSDVKINVTMNLKTYEKMIKEIKKLENKVNQYHEAGRKLMEENIKLRGIK